MLLFVAVRVGRSGDDLEDSQAAGLAETKSPRGSERDPGLEAERAATKRARETLRQDPSLKDLWEEGTLENFFVRQLMAPFDAAELRRLAKAKDQEDHGETMARLVVRAAAEKHPGFQDLLTRPELRKNPMLDMALCAYDYAVNGNREALERAAGTYEGDFDGPAAWALAYVDEWDVTKQMLETQPMGGEMGDHRHIFWVTRRYLFPQSRDFPDDYDRFASELSRAQEKHKGE
jgi:hypothetical protein